MINHDDGSGDIGPLYRVTKVAGHPPAGLDAVIGATTVTVETADQEYRLIGAGVKQDGVVLFQQKEAGSALDTGPVWIIADTGDGVFTARPRQWTDVVVERVRLPPARWGSASGLVGPDRARGHCGRNRRMNRH